MTIPTSKVEMKRSYPKGVQRGTLLTVNAAGYDIILMVIKCHPNGLYTTVRIDAGQPSLCGDQTGPHDLNGYELFRGTLTLKQ